MMPWPSPNFDDRGGAEISILVMHYTGMESGQAALERLCDRQAKVSAHYLVEEDGRVFQLVDEGKRAWHAGKGSWRAITNLNAVSIGIEIVNPGHEHGYRPFPAAQMEAVAELSHGILARHAIPPRNVIGHSDLAPMRKDDPGELFDWEWLAGQGIGLWPDAPARGVAWDGDEERLLRRLEEYGYGTEEVSPERLVLAFQRHFRPHRLDGAWDDECEARLEALLHFIRHPSA